MNFARRSSGQSAYRRWTVFLRPLPHSPALRYLARAEDSPATNFNFHFDLYHQRRRPERMGNSFGENNQRAGEQVASGQKADASFMTSQSDAVVPFGDLVLLASALLNCLP